MVAADQAMEPAHSRSTASQPRDADCWCQGEGRRRHEYQAYDETGWWAVKHRWEYCNCEVGRRMETEAVKEERHRLYVFALDLAGIPARFSRIGFRTFPVSPQTAGIVEKLRGRPHPGNDATQEEYDAFSTWRAQWGGSHFLWGPCGSGKTGLAVCYADHWLRLQIIADEVIEGEPAMLFRSVPDLLSELRDTYRTNASEREIIDRYASVPLLILDDLGAEHVKDSGWLEDRLYQIVGKRHAEERSTIFTSNLNLEQLAAKIGERITWRIVEACGADHILHVAGPNLRAK